ncbi:AN1-type zinc finger protein 4-like [Lycorma delicatula]|uniref:AN1-type zinc finger protein 4-like n=1 Tax=Lycorma delicatula TaxID=130591 RepID=UPI003F50F309
MMSYRDCQPLFKYHEEELIALFVETLTGTTFEMTVSPYDTIMSIKNKIQRVEGIPVSQQHLLYNLHELEDSAALMDYSITNGSTIKLVLSMRGGPISTVRRILPLDDITWRELIDFNRDELLEDLPPGCRMAVLVFREGDQLNMFRVLENVDGSYSPLSDSWSGSSMRNLFEEDDSDDYAKQRLEENTVTMEKMNDLKFKLEQLALQRKNNKLVNEKKYEEKFFTASSSSSDNKKENARVKSNSVGNNKRKNFLQLPPLEIDKKDSSPEPDSEGRIRKTRTAEFSRVPVLPDITPSPPSITIIDSDVESVTVPRPKTSPDRLTGQQICEILNEAGRHRLLGSHHCSASPLHRLPSVPSDDNNFETEWCSNRHVSSTKPLDKPSTSASLYRSNNTISDRNINRMPIVSPFSIIQGRDNSENGVSSLFSSTKVGKLPIRNISSRRSNITSHSVGGKSNKLTLTTFQSVPGSGGQIDPIEIKPKFLGTPASNASNKQLSSFCNESSRKFKNNSNCLLPHQSEEFSSKKTPHNLSKDNISSNKSDHLSPISGGFNSHGIAKQISKKKKKEPRSRCVKCNKRLTFTNTYTCRCGHIFCTNHRYSEAHDCTYDYKSEGRKILEQNNPLISAPKLPKI